jgi:hypothetical protein
MMHMVCEQCCNATWHLLTMQDAETYNTAATQGAKEAIESVA